MDGEGEPDVTIRHAPVSFPPGEAEGVQHSARWMVEGGEIKVVVLGVARYGATGGSVIRVDPDPAARDEDLQLYLSGPAMGAVLHQRGVLDPRLEVMLVCAF